MELNERLAQLRKEHGLSQNDLAEKLNVSRQAISRWEQGLAMPSSDNLIYLSRLYGITLDELFYPQIGVKPCSMAGGGVSKNIWNCFRTAPEGTGQPLTCSTSGMGLRLK